MRGAMRNSYGRGGDSRPPSRGSRFWELASRFAPGGGMAGAGMGIARGMADPQAEDRMARNRAAREAALRYGDGGAPGGGVAGGWMGSHGDSGSGPKSGFSGGGRAMLMKALMGGGY